MDNTGFLGRLGKFEISGRVTFANGAGGLPKINITTPRSTAEIYLHGAHVTAFQKTGESPLLFMGRRSQFASGKAIRGGVPVCFPWFGPREGDGMHGFARIAEWDLIETAAPPDGNVAVRFRLPPTAVKADWPAFRAEFVVVITDRLAMELITTNESADRNFDFENCLHTYFAVGDIAEVSLTGLQSTAFLDYAAGAGGAHQPGENSPLRIIRETNRVYLDTTSAVEIRDENLRRTIRVEKFNSRSTVVWNPWTTQKMPDDFDPAEHRRMVCVESGNVKQNKLSLPPGKSTGLKVVLSSHPL
jgi:glucose-6-phosphate 1-epimerase